MMTVTIDIGMWIALGLSIGCVGLLIALVMCLRIIEKQSERIDRMAHDALILKTSTEGNTAGTRALLADKLRGIANKQPPQEKQEDKKDSVEADKGRVDITFGL